eukprot:TRINITY_DN995_c0_g1_i2.p1 TRINITY_DN995_c0_g1~~TRINITY_DN995_c0_g1_i2.p1  ORF type:complete len:587 (-),score=94.50 TRINITY_DN995_c0_g1_i2:197-1957(-)
MTVSMKAVPLILMVMVAQCSGISVSGQMARDQLLVAPAAGKNQNQRPLMMQLQNQLINLAKEADKEGSTSGNTSGLSQFVGQVRTIVNTTMKANVLGRLSNEQTLLNTTYQAYFNCSPDMNQTSDEELQSLADNHTDCRNKEVDDYTNWTDCLDSANTTNATMNQECGNYNTLNQFPDTSECNNNDNDEKYDHLIDEVSRFRNLLGNLTAARDNCTNATQTHNDTMDECNRLALIYNGTKATCSSAQQALENKACTFNDHSECSAFDTCWNNANTSYDLGKTYALAQEDELKAEWHSILRIECYLDAFTQTNKSAHIDMCKTQQYDLSAINLTIYPIPNKTNCTEINDTHHVPGTWDFEDAWYTEISDQSLLDNCSASCCSLETTQPTTTTTTTRAPGTCTGAWEKTIKVVSKGRKGGSWGDWDKCAAGGKITGFKQKVEGKQGLRDDTAMNAVEFQCEDGATVKSSTSEWGSWSGWVSCPSGEHIVSYRMKSEGPAIDDTSVNGIRAKCSDGTVLRPSNTGKWGRWSSWEECPCNGWFCGVQTKVKGKGGKGGKGGFIQVRGGKGGLFKDAWALSHMKIKCCGNR